jgi:chromosome partitioning protein
MKSLAVLSTKGGSGKTTICLHLAVHASSPRRRGGIADCDSHGSASHWYRLRGTEDPPMRSIAPVDLLAFQRSLTDIDLMIIDGAPSHGDDVRVLAGLADFVLIPCRPQTLDLDGIRSAVEILVEVGTPAAILLNACPPGRAGQEGGQTTDAREALAQAPLPLCPVSITQRATFAHALTGGVAANEYEPNGKAAAEIAALWKWTARRL